MHRDNIYSGSEAEGRESGQRRALRLIDSEAPPYIYSVRVRGGKVTDAAVGDAMAELLGYEPAELESNRVFWTDMVHPDDKLRVQNAIDRLLHGQPMFEVYRIFRRDGQMRWVWHAAAPTVNSSGQVTTVIGLISPSGPPELLLGQIPEYRAMLDSMPIAVAVRDVKGRMTFCNTACALLYGYDTAEEMIGTTYADVMSPENYKEFQTCVLPRIRKGAWTGEMTLQRRDGASFYAQTATTLLRDEKGRPAAIYGVMSDITERKFAEPELISSQSLLRQFVEHTPAAVAMFDKDMRYLLVSDRWLADYNLGKQDIIGRSHYEVFPEIPERWKRIHRRVLAGHIQQCSEDSFVRIDGGQEWVRWDLRPWRDETGRIGGLIMYTEVITERKRAEQELRASRELLAVIQDSLPAEIAVLDQNGTIIAINKAWEIFARENGDPSLANTGVGVNYLDVCRKAANIGCEDAAVALETISSTLRGRLMDREMEYECPGKDRLRWFAMRVAPLLTEHGGAVVIHSDMTERKMMEEALRAGEERYRTLVENVDAIVFRVDQDWRPITIGGNVEGMIGWTAEEIMQSPEKWGRGLHPGDRQLMNEFLSRIRHTHQAGSLEFRRIARGGGVRWIRAHIRPRYNARGELMYYDGVDVDITERVEAQQRESRHTARVAALAQISRAAAGSLDAGTIVDMVTRQASSALQCLCVVLSVNGATDRLHVSAVAAQDHASAQKAREIVERIRYHLPGDTPPESMPGVNDLLPSDITPEQRAQIGPSIVAPVYVERRAFGLIVAVRLRGAEDFEDDDTWFLTEVASFVSAALTNASLYRRQSRIAETLQRSLIPASQDVPDLDIATCYLPSVTEAGVGGDFFDIIHLGDSKVGVVVGDVSGKGMEAAIHTAEAKYMLRSYALQNPDPGYVMTALNNALWRFTNEFMFVTLVYALIDTSTNAISYVNAGHEPPLVWCRARSSVYEYWPDGPALGIVKDHKYTSVKGKLNADDILLCYTDGVTDVPKNGERFGYDRLVVTVRDAKADNPEQLMDHILLTIRAFGHGKQPDDQVIVVVEPRK